MTSLERRQKLIDRQDVEIIICAFCGNEFCTQDVAATFDCSIHDWDAKVYAEEEKFSLCKNCFKKYMENMHRLELRYEQESDA